MTYQRREVLAEGVTLYLGDCRDVLPSLGRVDAVVTDPPYGIGESQRKNLSRHKLSECTVYAGGDFDHEPADESVINLIREFSDYQIIFGGNYFKLPPSKCWLVWDKQNGASDFADCELAWTNLDRAVRRIYWQWSGMIRKGEARGVKRVHLTQKPLEVMQWCLGFLPDDIVVCDPYMGSGTTGCAAVKTARKFIGVEKDPAYFDIACRRIEDALKRPDLFIPAPAPKAKQESLDV